MEKKKYIDYEQFYRQKIREFYQVGDYNGLLNYLLNLDKHGILNMQWKWHVGHAYTLNNKPEAAVDYLFHLHSFYPQQPDIQSALMEALKKAGKDIKNFCWLSEPKVKPVDRAYLDESFRFIRMAKKQIPIYLLYSHISKGEELNFDEFDLLQALKEDRRFHVLNETPYFIYSKVSIAPAGYKSTA